MTTTQMELLDLAFDGSKNLRRAVEALREGQVILLLDADDRENEGDLVVAAEKITKDSMNFLIKRGSGIVCLAMPKTRLDELGLPLMIPDNTNFFGTAFTVSIEAKSGVTTGVSAQDRAHTVQMAMAEDAESSHLVRPGHVFPLAAKSGGVFERMGHTEGSVDLIRIAGLKPGAVLCELMSEDGSMTTGDERIKFAKDFGIPVVSVEEILFYRIKNEASLTKKSHGISSRFGRLSWHSFNLLGHEVDVFQREGFSLEAEALRLYNVNSSGLKKRFMAQILLQTDDDPLVEALSALKEELADIVVMTRSEDALKRAELSVRRKAVICRTLCELLVKSIVINDDDLELSRIAEHFSISVNTKRVIL